MEWLAVIVVVIVLWLAFRKLKSKRTRTGRRSTKEPRELRIFHENFEWMQERWERADKERADGALKLVKPWHFDDVTEAQLARIDAIGLSIKGARLTKGQASDIIGLYEPVEPESAEVLRFFKVRVKGLNQSRARHEVSKLMAEGSFKEAWENRPATQWQKEFYRTFDYPVPKGLTHKAAAEFISEKEGDLLSTDATRYREWEEYEAIYEELSDPEVRADYDIKKVSVNALREAIVSLVEDGKRMEELSDDIQLVADRLIERNSSLYREST